MTLLHFRDTASDDAGGQANDGRGKLALVPNTVYTPHEPARSIASADLLVNHVVAYVQAFQPFRSRAVIVNYLVALKCPVPVVLVDSDRQAAVELTQLVAEAIVGAGSCQIVQLADADWHAATGQDSYFRAVHERFSALRLQEIMHAASDPANIGKAYFVCLTALTPTELAQHSAPNGVLATLPVAVAATAVATPEQAQLCAGQRVEFVRTHGVALRQHHAPLPSPVGIQRIWLQITAHDLAAARPARVAISTFERRSVA